MFMIFMHFSQSDIPSFSLQLAWLEHSLLIPSYFCFTYIQELYPRKSEHIEDENEDEFHYHIE